MRLALALVAVSLGACAPGASPTPERGPSPSGASDNGAARGDRPVAAARTPSVSDRAPDELDAARYVLDWWASPRSEPPPLPTGGTIGGSFALESPLAGRRGAHRNAFEFGPTQPAAVATLDRLNSLTGGDRSFSIERDSDIELAALVVLANASIGGTHQMGPRKQTTRDAAWLIRDWAKSSRVAAATPRLRALAALALSELYGLSFSVVARPQAEQLTAAVDADASTTKLDGPGDVEAAAWQLLALYVADAVELEVPTPSRSRLADVLLHANPSADAPLRDRALLAAARALAQALRPEPFATRASVADAFAPALAAVRSGDVVRDRGSETAFILSLAAAQVDDPVLRDWVQTVLHPMATRSATLESMEPTAAAWTVLCLTSFFHLPRSLRSDEHR